MPGSSLFPGALDEFPDITAETSEDAEGFEHDLVHNNEAAAISSLQAKVGIDGSTDVESFDYRVNALETGRLHHRRDDIQAAEGDNRITLNKTPFDDALTVFKNGSLIFGQDGVLTGKNYDLAFAARSGDVYSVMYWTDEGMPSASAMSNAGFNFTAQVLADGAVDFWTLDDTTSTAANKVSGGNALTIGSDVSKGVTPPLVGLYATCLRWASTTGINNGVTGSTSATMAANSALSIMAVVSVPGALTGNNEICHIGDYGVGGSQGVEYYINAADRTLGFFSSDGGNTGSTHVLPVATPVMLHVAYNPLAQTLKFYMNGVLVDTVSRTTGHTGGNKFSIGMVKSGVSYVNNLPNGSRVQACAWFNTELTASQILVQAQKAGFT